MCLYGVQMQLNSNHFFGGIPYDGFVKAGLIVYKTVISKELVNANIGTSAEKIEGLIHKLSQAFSSKPVTGYAQS